MPEPTSAIALAVALAVATSCGGSSATEGSSSQGGSGAGESSEGGERGSSARDDARNLGPGATFGDAASAASRLDDRQQTSSEAGCILRGLGRVGEPWRLEADIAVAVRPLPAVADELDARLRVSRGPVRVLSRWGQAGRGAQDVALVAFTSTSPAAVRGSAIAVAVTDQGVYVRSSDRAAGDDELAPTPAVAAAGRVRALADADASSTIYVTAESRVTLDKVLEVLRTLPSDSHDVALAVVLDPSTRLPDSAGPTAGQATSASAGLCPDGLPPPQGMQEGELRPPAIVGALGPLREGAARCMSSATGASAAGGSVIVAFRIGPDGRVVHTCMRQDAVGDAALRLCILNAARATTFPTPSPGGYVDVELPLRLAPDSTMRQRVVCEE